MRRIWSYVMAKLPRADRSYARPVAQGIASCDERRVRVSPCLSDILGIARPIPHDPVNEGLVVLLGTVVDGLHFLKQFGGSTQAAVFRERG